MYFVCRFKEGTQYLGQFQQILQQAEVRYFPADFSQMIFLIYGTFSKFSPTISYFLKKLVDLK